MNTNELEQLIATLTGIKDGKEWQIQGNPTDAWRSVNVGSLTPLEYLKGGWKLRLKPAPVYVPLTAADVPPGSVLRCKRDQPRVEFWFITKVASDGASLIGHTITWDDLQASYEILRPGGEWALCRKEAQS